MNAQATKATAAAAPKADPVQEQIVHKAIKEISNIATLPEVTLKIIKLVEDPDSTAQDLNKVISNDSALGARVLKVVNSAFYGLPGQIGSINRAIVLLGLNAVKNIAIAASLAKLFRGGSICPGFDAKDLWSHSVAVAAAGKLLGDRANLGLPDEAFLAGLIHDLGIMVEIQARRAKFVEAFEHFEKDGQVTFRDAEIKCIGATHEQFGKALCTLWKFPASLGYVTGFHHHPLDLSPEHRTLTGLIHVADIVAARAEIGFTRTVEVEQPDPKLLEELKLSQDDVDQTIEALPDAIDEADTMLNAA